jgi:hypothetical protein
LTVSVRAFVFCREIAVPLLSAAIQLEASNPHYVRFPMECGGKTITVHIATSWLVERASRDGLPTRNTTLLCHFYRDMIEAAASAKYDRAHCEGADVVVVGSDF